MPLSRNATFTVILLSFIGGLRTFDLIWTMTRGGPGFASDVIASTIYKQYQAGFYGLATAGNVILFIGVAADRLSDDAVLLQARDRPVRAVRGSAGGGSRSSGLAVAGVVFVVPFIFIVLTAAKDRVEAARFEFTLPTEWHLIENIGEVLGRAEWHRGHGDAQQPDPDGRLGDGARRPGGDGRLRPPAPTGSGRDSRHAP